MFTKYIGNRKNKPHTQQTNKQNERMNERMNERTNI